MSVKMIFRDVVSSLQFGRIVATFPEKVFWDALESVASE